MRREIPLVADPLTVISLTGGIPGVLQNTVGTFRLARHGSWVVAAWVAGTFNSSGTDAMVTVSTDHGATWRKPVRANALSAGAVWDLDLTVSAGRILVVYNQNSSPGMFDANVFASVSTDAGATFKRVRLNSRPASVGYPMRHPVCALENDRAVAAWVDTWRNLPIKTTVAATSRDGGRTWTSEKRITTPDVFTGGKPPVAIGHDSEGAVCVAARTVSGVRVTTMHKPRLTRLGTYAPGQSVSYRIDGAGQSDDGGFALLVLSATGPGTKTGGIALPGGRRLLVDPDLLTWSALQLGPLVIAGPIQGGIAQTTPWKVPPGLSLPALWAASVVIKPAAVGSITDTLKAN